MINGFQRLIYKLSCIAPSCIFWQFSSMHKGSELLRCVPGGAEVGGYAGEEYFMRLRGEG